MSEPADRQAEHETARKAYVYLTPEIQADAEPLIRMFMGADDSCKTLLGSTNNPPSSHRRDLRAAGSTRSP